MADTRIFIVGFMGAGKTTVGRALAARFDTAFCDLDERIQAETGRRIEEIFATEGEPGFRRIESELLNRVVTEPAAVVATGGGTFCRAENRRLIRTAGISVWLDAPLELILQRGPDSIEDRRRPLWGHPDKLRALLESRLPYYRQADLRLDASRCRSTEELVDRLAEALERYCVGT